MQSGLENKRMNILVYRTVRPEEMGYVIRDICDKYGDNNNITVITRPENKVTMESIEGIDEVILYSNNIFQFNNKIISSANLFTICPWLSKKAVYPPKL